MRVFAHLLNLDGSGVCMIASRVAGGSEGGGGKRRITAIIFLEQSQSAHEGISFVGMICANRARCRASSCFHL